jgi:integrase
LLYATAAATGLRRGELAALKVSDLDADKGGLRLHSSWTKDRKEGFAPVASWVMAELVEAAKGKGPDDTLLDVPLHSERTIGRDMERTGIERQAFGGKAVFHSLRKSFGTLVDQAGASQKEAMTLLRHAPPGLTYGVYVQADEGRLKVLAEAVGEAILPESVQASVQLAATGTDDVVGRQAGAVSYGVVMRVGVGGSNPPPATKYPCCRSCMRLQRRT